MFASTCNFRKSINQKFIVVHGFIYPSIHPLISKLMTAKMHNLKTAMYKLFSKLQMLGNIRLVIQIQALFIHLGHLNVD